MCLLIKLLFIILIVLSSTKSARGGKHILNCYQVSLTPVARNSSYQCKQNNNNNNNTQKNKLRIITSNCGPATCSLQPDWRCY